MKIGERIKNRRIELNITQDELARRLGYSDKSSISRMENSSKLTLNKVQLLADALNVSPSYLMGWEDEINVDMDIENNSGTISNSIGSDSTDTNNTYTTNNYYSSPCSQKEATTNKDVKATVTSKELFYEMLMVLKDMDDEQLKDMIRYGNFILKG
jgi:transcriptional regulator with XRE-family HTH domain|nr:MAG TPA: helix-turn-helix domain protein [Caudoviricetes sp.]